MLRKEAGCKGVDLTKSEKGYELFSDNISNSRWNICSAIRWWNSGVTDFGTMWKERSQRVF